MVRVDSSINLEIKIDFLKPIKLFMVIRMIKAIKKVWKKF